MFVAWVTTNLSQRIGERLVHLPAPVTFILSQLASTNHADVVFYTVTGGGHTWAGGKAMPDFIVGKTTPDIDATRVMWNFFMEHPLVR